MENPTDVTAGDTVLVVKNRGFPLPYEHTVTENTVATGVETDEPTGVIRCEDGSQIEVWGDECLMATGGDGYVTEQVVVVGNPNEKDEIEISPADFDA